MAWPTGNATRRGFRGCLATHRSRSHLLGDASQHRQRARLHHGKVRPAASTQWRAGCLAAQASLRGPDALRHSSPYYRQGWNSYQAAATSPDQSASGTNTAGLVKPTTRIAAAPAAAAPVVDAPANPPPTPANSGFNGAVVAGAMVVIVVVLFGLALYFLPTLIAAGRRKRNTLAIFALNLFLGWTMLGWVLALVWSLSVDAQPPARA